MATPAQLKANRRNSQSSTGPRTAVGKATSSRNSTRTGLYAKSLIIDGEDPGELAALQQDYFDSCDPQGALETALVIQLIRYDWFLRRMAAVERQVWDGSIEHVRGYDHFEDSTSLLLAFNHADDRIILVQGRVASLSRSFHRTLNDLIRLQAIRAKRPTAQPPQPASPAAPEIGFVSPIPARRTRSTISPATKSARTPSIEIGFVPSITARQAPRTVATSSPAPSPRPPAPSCYNMESGKRWSLGLPSVENVHTCGPLRSLLDPCKIR